jgi:hypothetical protein
MLTYEDCLGMTDLTQEEVEAISEHEHCPDIVALELGNYLVHRPEGPPLISRMILDDIAVAEASGKLVHSVRLKLVLKRFCDRYPDALTSPAGPSAAR